ncbi:MAG: NAD-dependent epimerase/dehydratase family protein [Deltaproteobacteria bacterium]|nr:NAD-dependent epimerase/dehydratase family protein [Deltaproteobacteria bacterium]
MRSLVALAPRYVVYVSSGEVYGRGRVPFSESDVPAPLTSYAKAKLAGERAVSLWCAHSGVPRALLRPAVVYGPRQTGRMLIPAALRALARGARFPTTDGHQTRDFVSVHDVVELIQACVERGVDGIFNAGSGEERRVRDVLLMLAHRVGENAEQLLEFGALETRAGEAERYVLEVSAGEKTLGWRPRIELAEGLDEFVEWCALRA